MDAASDLLKLAEAKFGKLTPAERKLFRATAEGEIADYSPRGNKPIDPANAAKWGPSRILLADRIAWLCTDKQASQLVTNRGIRIKGARIDDAFELEHAKVAFPLLFEKCKFTGDLNFLHAHIVALYMPGTHIGKLYGGGLRTTGSIYFRENFAAAGEVILIGARLGGDLDCSNGQFTDEAGYALSADGLKVDGDVFLREGFRAEGIVSLGGATIGGNLDCRRGTLSNRGRVGLFCNGLGVKGDVLLCDKLRADCEISLVGARITGLLHCTGLISPREVKLDFRYARIGTLRDEQESWPVNGKLYLHGLTYKEIHNKAPRDSNRRINWIQRQGKFWSQPYEQLAKVLRESGDNTGARNVLVAKNKDKARLTKLTFPEKCWYYFFGRPIGYGYKPWLALPLALVIVLFGSVFFKEGYSHGLITPPSESAYTNDKSGVPDPGDVNRRISEVYPVFDSLFYSIDVFVPVVDLHQVKYWLPNANRGSELVPGGSAAFCTGGLLLLWLWVETALGWILTTLFLVGITGLVRT